MRDLLRENIFQQGGRVFDYDKSKIDKKIEKAFAICVKADETDALIPLKVYEVVLSKTDYVGVIDENGEKFICPSNCFVFLDLSKKTSQLLKRAVTLT